MNEDDYEWDANKADSNRRKHRIDFADVIPVFEKERRQYEQGQ